MACSGRGVLLAANMLVEDGLGGLQGRVGGDGDVGGHACALPAGPGGGVRVDRGDAEEDVALTHLEGLGRMGRAGGGFTNDHGPTQPLHDVNELLGGAGGGLTGQDDEALLGAVPLAWRGEEEDIFDGVTKETPSLTNCNFCIFNARFNLLKLSHYRLKNYNMLKILCVSPAMPYVYNH